MAISANASVLALLKVWYKDGVQNLMFRNSPVLQKIKKVRVEGKSQNFAAMFGRGGAVGANFNVAKQNAENTSTNVEFSVKPGQLFSVYTMNSKEVQASATKRGAYMRIAGAKMFAASEGFRKTMAAALYGRGFGELAPFSTAAALEVSASEKSITVPADMLMKIDVNSQLVFKTSIENGAAVGVATVKSINNNDIGIIASGANFTLAANTPYIICLDGSIDSAGLPLLPVGLDGWLPAIGNRQGADWENYIGQAFFGVNRKLASDRLCGAFVVGSNAEKYSTTVKKLLRKVRRQGSMADMIIMNDEDFEAFAEEIEATNTYFTKTSTKERREANTGFNAFSASFSTNYIENIIDDPYCPRYKFYILDSEAIELWSYTNVDNLDDGIANNNPGKQDPMAMDGEGKENHPDGLIIDDYLNIQPGSGSVDGPNTNVTLQFFGSFVVTNPSVCGVGIFKGNNTYIGYTA